MKGRLRPAWIVLVALGAAAWLFACGLPGGFLLDDFSNLDGLSLVAFGPAYAAYYVFNGVTGFPGRPIAYASFFLQHASWPGDPAAFKLVNIALHLANAGLLFLVLSQCARLARWREGGALAAIAAAFWVLHPIQVSTVLYVVQRMTELETLFSLAALAAYLHGRSLALGGRTAAGYGWMSGAMALGVPLAVLAKENGALIPLYAAVIEFTLLAGVPRPARWGRWAAVFLALPTAALAVYVGHLVWHPAAAYANRDFSLAQRLYTEAVVLWDYVGKIVLPRPRAFGLYFDDYPVAQAPWRSAHTFLAFAGWAACAAAAIAWRRRWPALSFAVLWFLAGHALESTVLPLELYFEHRNYLPLAGPALALAWIAWRLWDRASSVQARRGFAALGLAAAGILGAVTWVEAKAWADPIGQAAYWARERPGSLRAQYALTGLFIAAGRYADAYAVLSKAVALAPEQGYLWVAQVRLACMDDSLPIPAFADVAAHMSRSRMQPVLTAQLWALASAIEQGQCPRIRPAEALPLADALIQNPHAVSAFRWRAWYSKAHLYAAQHDLDAAMRALESANALRPDLAIVHDAAVWLSSAALYADALRFIDQARSDPRWRVSERLVNAPILAAWESEVRDAARRAEAGSGS